MFEDHVQFPAGTTTVSPLLALAIAELTCDDEQLAALIVAANEAELHSGSTSKKMGATSGFVVFIRSLLCAG
jgi:hypothetical protein